MKKRVHKNQIVITTLAVLIAVAGYVMEFKLDGTAEEALLQINEKHYAQPFESNDRELFKIGVNFSAKTRNIEKWVVEKGGK